MIAYHTTTVGRLTGILARGLDPAKSRQGRRAVWLHAKARGDWAFLHVVHRHGGRVQSVVRLTVSVPRSWLRRHATGVWYCDRVIPPDRIRAVTTWGAVCQAIPQAS